VGIPVWSNYLESLAVTAERYEPEVAALMRKRAFYPDQRYVGLSHVALESNDLYIGQVPASDIAIPGYYLLFACTDKNVPSVGVFVQILT
jgi:galactose oxidase-like protein